MQKKQYTIFETFVGAGGSHLGFKNNNFRTVYVNDFDDSALKTLVHNNPELLKEKAFIDNRSIIDIDPKQLRNCLNVDVGEIDVFFGGIVCKGFSLAGERNPMDERNFFYHKQLELVEEFRPKISIIENVVGILNAKVYAVDKTDPLAVAIDELWSELNNYKGQKSALRKNNAITKEFELKGKDLNKQKKDLLKQIEDSKFYISVMDEIKAIYDKLGYKLHVATLNSAWYGAATKRERVIMVAIRNDIEDIFEYPKPIYMNKDIYKSFLPKECLNLPKPKTVNSALSEINYTIDDPDNVPMNHQPKTIERFKYIPEGDNIANHMDKVPKELRISKFYSRGSTMRLDGNSPSPTLVPGHSNFPVHPKEHRSITVREAATITGFPTDYKFFGSHTKRCEQVGNAVPPPLSFHIARQCIKVLDNYYKNID